MSGVFLQAQWRHLVVLNFEIDPEILSPMIPRGVELDNFKGRTLISLVAFEFAGARLLGVPIPFHQLFPEINLRCYVRRRVNDYLRRGVFFLKEIVPKRAVVLVANWLFNEAFSPAKISHSIDPEGAEFHARLGAHRIRLRARRAGELTAAAANSEESFVLEHYYAYNVARRGHTLEYQVEHPRWRIWRAEARTLKLDAEEIYGDAIGSALRRAPTSVFIADGSEVRVHTGVALPAHQISFTGVNVCHGPRVLRINSSP
jgi:uncharacterized protein YqjF (DUF2071 family)